MTRTRKGDGQTALVTGASVGIGVDLAECFAADGYDLILAARTESALRAVADRLADTHGIRATPIAADLGVIVAGGGIGGLTTAIALRHHGIGGQDQ
jgi:short-subunit dehydrogenase